MSDRCNVVSPALKLLSYIFSEVIRILSTETCTITALLHGNRPTKGYDILRGMESGTTVGVDENGKSYLNCRLTLAKADHTSALQIKLVRKTEV